MKHLFSLLLCLLMGFTYAAHAQEHLISLDKVSVDIRKLPLQVVEVVDVRANKAAIGWVQKGITNQKQAANFKKGFNTEIQEFINKFGAKGEEALPLAIKVQKLAIWEETKFSTEYAHASLALAFYVKRNDHYFFLGSATAVTKSAGMDVTGRHDDNLATVFQLCFDQLSGQNVQELLAGAQPLSLDQVMDTQATAAQILNYPIFAAAPKAGVYHSFQEFKNNAPSDLIPISIKEKGRLDFVAHYTPDNKKIKEAWGFSDGETFYIRYSNDYFPLVQHESGFVFYGYGAMDGQQVATAAFLGGAIGGAIAGATSGKGQTVEYSLNMLTGTVQSFEDEIASSSLEPALVSLYRRGKDQSEAPALLMVNDTLSLEMAANAVHTLSFVAPLTEINLCIQDADGACTTFTPTTGATRYIEVSVPEKKDHAPSVKVVDEQVGQFYIRQIEIHTEKQQKRASKK